jgi:biopolymer transport protein ExbD
MRTIKSRRVNKKLDLDITSLLDILIILLVFLLKSYNPESMKIPLVDDLKLPSINHLSSGIKDLNLEVNRKKEVFLNKKKLGNLNGKKNSLILKNKLEKIFLQRKGFSGINLFFDKDNSYGNIKGIMSIVKRSGFKKMKLILMRGD